MSNSIVGIDEAGRGPLAGPLVVCALSLLEEIEFFESRGIRDSKKLTEKKRGEIFLRIQHEASARRLKYAVCFISAPTIDKYGISAALKEGVATVLQKIDAKDTDEVLLDGSLCAPGKYKNQRTLIKGDETEVAIALASIVAKVLRDQKMLEIAQEFPNYSFERHKGYGTAAHREALSLHGLSPAHRRSFCRNIITSTKKVHS